MKIKRISKTITCSKCKKDITAGDYFACYTKQKKHFHLECNPGERMNINEQFNKCVTVEKDGMLHEVECRKGLWGISCRDKAAALREGMHYFKQYLADGEYDDLLVTNGK